MRLFFLLLVPMLLICGCNAVPSSKLMKEAFVSKDKPKQPVRMIAFWQCYAQTNPGGEPFRGVGGRILFYGEEKKNAKKTKDPIMVDGELTMYLFDAHDSIPEKSVPIRHAIFKKETLPLHYRKDELGFHGYDFFVPMDPIDSPEMDVAVLAMYVDAKKGTILHSSLATLTLAGSAREEPEPVLDPLEEKRKQVIDSVRNQSQENGGSNGGSPEQGEIRQASYNASSPNASSPRGGENADAGEPQVHSRTERIRLPDHYAQYYRNEQYFSKEPTEDPFTPIVPREPGFYQYRTSDNTTETSDDAPSRKSVPETDATQSTFSPTSRRTNIDWPKLPRPMSELQLVREEYRQSQRPQQTRPTQQAQQTQEPDGAATPRTTSPFSLSLSNIPKKQDSAPKDPTTTFSDNSGIGYTTQVFVSDK